MSTRRARRDPGGDGPIWCRSVSGWTDLLPPKLPTFLVVPDPGRVGVVGVRLPDDPVTQMGTRDETRFDPSLPPESNPVPPHPTLRPPPAPR